MVRLEAKHIEDILRKQLDAKEAELAALRKQIDELQPVRLVEVALVDGDSRAYRPAKNYYTLEGIKHA